MDPPPFKDSAAPLLDASAEANAEAQPFKSNSKFGPAADATAPLIDNAQAAREARIVYWSIFCLNIGVQWPYQSIIQAQTYYSQRFPDVNLEFLILIVSTWPLLVSHTVQVLTGAADRWGFTPRILGAFLVFQLMAGVVIIQDLVSLSEWGHIGLILMSGVVLATAQSFSEPPLYAIAGVFPDGSATQAMQAGNGLTGVIVICVNILARVAVGGGSSTSDLRNAMYLFFGVQILYTCFCYLIYIRLRKLPTCIRYINEARAKDPHAASAGESPLIGTGATVGGGGLADDRLSAPTYESTHNNGIKISMSKGDGGAAVQAADAVEPHSRGRESCGVRFRELLGVAKDLWIVAGSQFYIFFLTLMLWPTIPCGTNLAGSIFNGGASSWYCATIIIGTFNFGDLTSRVIAGSAWGMRLATSGMPMPVMGLLSLARSLFIPLIILCATQPNPIMPNAAWVVIFFTFCLAMTNGFLGTLTMMRGPLLVEPHRREHASYVMVFFLYLGLALGSVVSYALGNAMNFPAS